MRRLATEQGDIEQLEERLHGFGRLRVGPFRAPQIVYEACEKTITPMRG